MVGPASTVSGGGCRPVMYAFGSFNTNGWYKTNANPDNCDWDANHNAQNDCPKFVPNPNQDDYF